VKDGAKVFSEFVGLIPPAASGPTTATIVDQIEAFKSEYPVLAIPPHIIVQHPLILEHLA
jgi:hypothetical protein